MVYLQRHDLTNAADYCRRSLALEEKLGDPRGIAAQTGNLAMVHLEQGHLETAETLQRKAAATFESVGDRNGTARNYANLALVLHRRGTFREVVVAHRRALSEFEAMNDARGAAGQWASLADAHLRLDEYRDTEEAIRRALSLYDPQSDRKKAAHLRVLRAELHMRMGELTLAEECLRALHQEGLCDEVVAAYVRLAQAYIQADEPKEAHAILARVLEFAANHCVQYSGVVKDAVVWGHRVLGNAALANVETDTLAFEAARTHYSAALGFVTDPSAKRSVLVELAVGYRRRARVVAKEEARELLDAARDSLELALSMKPDPALVAESASIIADSASLASTEDAGRLYDAATQRYEEALALDPRDTYILCDLGACLRSRAAHAPSGEEATALFQRACKVFEEAASIAPDDNDIMLRWGIALRDLGENALQSDAGTIFAGAIEKIGAAQRREPDNHEITYDLALAYAYRAGFAKGGEAEDLLAKAASLYETVLASKPENVGALQNLADIRAYQATGKDTATAALLLEDSLQKLLLVETLAPGTGTYSLACVYARLGKDGDARSLLMKLRDTGGLPDRDHLATDPDLAVIRDQPWFATLLDVVSTAPGL